MRDTPYATEIATGSHTFNVDEEARVERIFIKRQGEEQIRFSWWKNGNMLPRPLDLNEDELFDLLQNGINRGVFTDEFRTRLRAIL